MDDLALSVGAGRGICTDGRINGVIRGDFVNEGEKYEHAVLSRKR